jgi:hypothetical protein
VHAGNRALPVCDLKSPVTTEGSAGPAPGAAWPAPTGPDGGAPTGFSWKLPADPTCARSARTHVRQSLAGLLMPQELIDDAELAVSELASNAWQHALGAGLLPGDAGTGAALPELWLYRRGGALGAELVCGIFDARRDTWPQPRQNSLSLLPDNIELADPLLDTILADDPASGRGLSIVQTVSHASGCHRTRSRLSDPAVPGKVAWFTMQIPRSSPAAQPASADFTSAQAAHALSELLAERGIPGISHRHLTQAQSAVSMAAGLTVRCQDEIFQWPADGTGQRAYFDLGDALENIIRLHEDLTCARSQTSRS